MEKCRDKNNIVFPAHGYGMVWTSTVTYAAKPYNHNVSENNFFNPQTLLQPFKIKFHAIR